MPTRPPLPDRRSTIRDVALLAGVSVGTASRALSGTGRVSEATIAAVKAAARKLQYEPDVLAQSLRRQSTGTVGLLVADIADPVSAQVAGAIEDVLQREGRSLLLANTYHDMRREESLIEQLRRRRIDGIILGPCAEERPELMARLRRQGVPVVGYGRELDEGGSGVHIDHYNGSLSITRYLLNLGHRRIALLTESDKRLPGRERIAGYRDAYAERGLTPDPTWIRVERSSMEFAFSEALALVSTPERPTAFLCLGTRILSRALQGIRHSGLQIPEELSVVSVGDNDLSKLFSPPITTIAWSNEAVGRSLAELLLKRIAAPDGSAIEPERILITTQLVLRDSTGPVATAAPRARPRSAASPKAGA